MRIVKSRGTRDQHDQRRQFRGVGRGVALPSNYENIVLLQSKNRRCRAGSSYKIGNFYNLERAE